MGDLNDYALLDDLIELYYSVATANVSEEIKSKFTLADAKRDFVLGTFLMYFCHVATPIVGFRMFFVRWSCGAVRPCLLATSRRVP